MVINGINLLLIIFSILPSSILFVPIFYLLKKSKKFNWKTGAISNLNNFASTRRPFILLMSLYALNQMFYLILILITGQILTGFLFPIIFFTLLMELLALPIPSHKLGHMFLVGLSHTVLFLVMFFISFKLPSTNEIGIFIRFGILAIAAIIGTILIILMASHKKTRYWLLEYCVLGLFGVWNLAMIFS